MVIDIQIDEDVLFFPLAFLNNDLYLCWSKYFLLPELSLKENIVTQQLFYLLTCNKPLVINRMLVRLDDDINTVTAVCRGTRDGVIVLCVEIQRGTADGSPFNVHLRESERDFFECETEIGVRVVEFDARGGIVRWRTERKAGTRLNAKMDDGVEEEDDEARDEMMHGNGSLIGR